MNSLEIPLTAGYVPYKNPYFKLFLYGGWVSTFNIARLRRRTTATARR